MIGPGGGDAKGDLLSTGITSAPNLGQAPGRRPDPGIRDSLRPPPCLLAVDLPRDNGQAQGRRGSRHFARQLKRWPGWLRGHMQSSSCDSRRPLRRLKISAWRSRVLDGALRATKSLYSALAVTRMSDLAALPQLDPACGTISGSFRWLTQVLCGDEDGG